MHWVERASFVKICRLLEISKQERHHEVLLTMKNLHDLSRHDLNHFMVADLLSLIPGGSSPAREAESEATGRELVINT